MEEIILLGIGGHAHSVVDSIESNKNYSIYGFLDIESRIGEQFRGYKVVGTDNLLESCFHKGIKNAFVTVGYLGKGDIRKKLYKKLKGIGFTLPNIVDRTAILANDVILGEGIFVGKRAVINSAAEIGNMCIINTGAIVEHDCKVGDFSHIAVGSALCGSVQVGKEAFIGANATVIQGKRIGNKCIIGAGTTVRKDVEDKYMVWNGEKVKMLRGGGNLRSQKRCAA